MLPGANTGSTDSGRDRTDQVKPDLLDFLFTLALTIGIAPELVGREGLISKSWTLGIPDLAFLTNLGAFLLAVSTLLFSWYGFNASINNNPVLYGSVAGMLRFFLDAFLVVLYGFLLIVYEQLEIVVALLVVIFLLYTIWDFLKLAEYRKEPFDGDENQSQNDNSLLSFGCSIICKLCERRSIIYFAFVLAVFILEVFVFDMSVFLGLWEDVIVILLLFAITIIYRIDKVEWTYLGDEEKIARIEGTDEADRPKQAS